MATITMTIPDEQMDDVAAAAATTIHDQSPATNAETVQAALAAYLTSLYIQHMQRSAATDDPTAAAALVAEAAAQQARQDALDARVAAQSAARDLATANAALWT